MWVRVSGLEVWEPRNIYGESAAGDSHPATLQGLVRCAAPTRRPEAGWVGLGRELYGLFFLEGQSCREAGKESKSGTPRKDAARSLSSCLLRQDRPLEGTQPCAPCRGGRVVPDKAKHGPTPQAGRRTPRCGPELADRG